MSEQKQATDGGPTRTGNMTISTPNPNSTVSGSGFHAHGTYPGSRPNAYINLEVDYPHGNVSWTWPAVTGGSWDDPGDPQSGPTQLSPSNDKWVALTATLCSDPQGNNPIDTVAPITIWIKIT
jgi:hypothetical protein